MKNFLSITVLLMPLFLNAQSAFHNFGNVKLHTSAAVGFHTDLINDGTLNNDNQGFAGFYSDSEIRAISGSNRAIFSKVEIDAVNDVELYTSLGVSNELNFINGKVFTPRNNQSISLDYINHQLSVGEDDSRYVDGYVTVTGTDEFIFPIGHDNKFRPMVLPTQNVNNTFRGAYYAVNPNTAPSNVFSQNFDTNEKQLFINTISNVEFWDLDGAAATTITLTWNAASNVAAIAEDVNLLRVVGWSKTENKWIDLGRTAVSGDLNAGTVSSKTFTPDEYEVITIGAEYADGDLSDVNIIITPNGDDKNEALVFDGLEQYKNNTLSIVNRWGNQVYEATDYKNNWKGTSEGRATVNKTNDLPVGTYFYVLKFGDDGLSKTQLGWIYIHR
jgi:gliding motility-associated-like protein